jgi:hypothetical protein
MGATLAPTVLTGTGMGKIYPRGDGDGKSFPDREFPVAIFDHDKFSQLARYAPNEVREDADKQCLFLKGIYYDLHLQLKGNNYTSF